MEAHSMLSSVNDIPENDKVKKGQKKMERLIRFIRESGETDFTGYIKINYSQGNIGRVEKFEEIIKK